MPYFHNNFRVRAKFSDFLDPLRSAFFENATEMQQSVGHPRYPFPLRFQYLSPELLVVAAIARAIQVTVIDTPSTYFDVDKVVPEDAVVSLLAVDV
jgi:hypothetical protein